MATSCKTQSSNGISSSTVRAAAPALIWNLDLPLKASTRKPVAPFTTNKNSLAATALKNSYSMPYHRYRRLRPMRYLPLNLRFLSIHQQEPPRRSTRTSPHRLFLLCTRESLLEPIPLCGCVMPMYEVSDTAVRDAGIAGPSLLRRHDYLRHLRSFPQRCQ